jgi:hypothetical protein
MLPWNNFPFNEEIKKMLHNRGTTEIDKYVYDMVSKMLPQEMAGMMNPQAGTKGVPPYKQHNDQQDGDTTLRPILFETHDFVFIRIPIRNEESLKKLKIYHTSHELIIENHPSTESKNTYPLPVPVRKKGAIATYKDSILEIRIPRSIQTQISEISIPDALE